MNRCKIHSILSNFTITQDKESEPMNIGKRCAWLLALSVLVLAACGAPQATNPEPAMAATEQTMTEGDTMMETMTMTDTAAMMEETHAMTATEMMTDSHAMTATEMMTDSHMMTETGAMNDAQAMADLPAWQTLPLTDARTGEQIVLADLAGKTVFVETMATWCTNCRQQLNNVAAARAQLGNDEVVFIAVSVETNISATDLAQYATDNSFDWTFAVSTPEMLVELANAFGQTIANPPATPHFIIRPDGSVTDLITGIDSPEQLIQDLQAAQG